MDLSVSEIVLNGQRMFLGLVHDVTERKRAEDALRWARDELRSAFRHRTAELLTVNESLKQERYLFGSSWIDLPHNIYFKDAGQPLPAREQGNGRLLPTGGCGGGRGQDRSRLLRRRACPEAMADEQEILRSGQPVLDKEEKEVWPDGRVTWVATTKMPLYDEAGQLVGTFGISRDITERKKWRKPCGRPRKRPKRPTGPRAPSWPT